VFIQWGDNLGIFRGSNDGMCVGILFEAFLLSGFCSIGIPDFTAILMNKMMISIDKVKYWILGINEPKFW